MAGGQRCFPCATTQGGLGSPHRGVALTRMAETSTPLHQNRLHSCQQPAEWRLHGWGGLELGVRSAGDRRVGQCACMSHVGSHCCRTGVAGHELIPDGCAGGPPLGGTSGVCDEARVGGAAGGREGASGGSLSTHAAAARHLLHSAAPPPAHVKWMVRLWQPERAQKRSVFTLLRADSACGRGQQR